MTQQQRQKNRKFFVIILFNFFIMIALFLIVEGLANTIFVVRSAFFKDLMSERKHTQYDEEIGWINLPNLTIKDMYDGKSFVTNSMSFRNDKEFSYSVPSDKVRVICSGDSLTMGFGVGNDDVWCSRLESIDSQIETINLGLGGYGFDQAFLWYKRNNLKFKHDVHIFAFIFDDFRRMQSDTFFGYGRPFLVLKNNELINVNKPVPIRSYLIPRLPRIQSKLGQLSSVRLLKRILFRTKDPLLAQKKKNEKDKKTQEVVAKIIEDLQKLNREKNSILVLVQLPILEDYMSSSRSEQWRQFIHTEEKRLDFLFIDLIDEFRKYPAQKVQKLFLPDGHYSEEGNAYIANILYKKLLSIPEIAQKLHER